MYSFVFRVDSGNVPELGTGHLYRCIKIYNYLIKKKVNKNKILFIIKTKGNYKTSKKILKQFDIKYISIDSNIRDATLEENLFLKKYPAKVIIFDRLTRLNNNFLKRIKKNFRKVAGIDLLVNRRLAQKCHSMFKFLNESHLSKSWVNHSVDIYRNNLGHVANEFDQSYKEFLANPSQSPEEDLDNY